MEGRGLRMLPRLFITVQGAEGTQKDKRVEMRRKRKLSP